VIALIGFLVAEVPLAYQALGMAFIYTWQCLVQQGAKALSLEGLSKLGLSSPIRQVRRNVSLASVSKVCILCSL
jgi:hypothetical protein